MTNDCAASAGSRRGPVDHAGLPIAPGSLVRVLSIASCARGLPEEDQARLRGIVGRLRAVARIDDWGFVWLSFDDACVRDDFCLMGAEVEVA